MLLSVSATTFDILSQRFCFVNNFFHLFYFSFRCLPRSHGARSILSNIPGNVNHFFIIFPFITDSKRIWSYPVQCCKSAKNSLLSKTKTGLQRPAEKRAYPWYARNDMESSSHDCLKQNQLLIILQTQPCNLPGIFRYPGRLPNMRP